MQAIINCNVHQTLAESEQVRREPDDTGPLVELEYWQKMNAKFNSILEQIRSHDCKMAIHILHMKKCKLLTVSLIKIVWLVSLGNPRWVVFNAGDTATRCCQFWAFIIVEPSGVGYWTSLKSFQPAWNFGVCCFWYSACYIIAAWLVCVIWLVCAS